ncbi:MAG: hypothetical protein AAFW47_00235 [Pseudomonadota bacterium]
MLRAAQALVIRPPVETTAVRHRQTDKLLAGLARLGIHTTIAKAGDVASMADVGFLPDMLMLDVSDPETVRSCQAIAQKLRLSPLARRLTLAILGDNGTFGAFDADLHLNHLLSPAAIARKIKQHLRISAIHTEYMRRLDTAQSLGVAIEALPPDAMEKPTKRLLVLGRGERYFALFQLFKGGAVLKAAKSFTEACDLLRDDAFDCLIVDSKTFSDFTLDDVTTLKQNPRHFHLPVLILADEMDEERRRAFEDSLVCDVFDFDENAEDVAAYATSLIAADHVRKELLKAFTSPQFDPLRVEATGLSTDAFFSAHLDRLLKTAEANRQTVIIGIIDVAPTMRDEDMADDTSFRTIMDQAGRLIASLIRAEDLATHLAPDRFLIVSSNSTGLAMSSLMGRIDAILRMTQFSLKAQSVTVDVDTHYFEARDGDTVYAVFERISDG